MAFVLKIRRMDIHTGGDARVVVLRGHDAAAFGINPGDRLEIRYRRTVYSVVADITHHSIRHGEIGLFEEVWRLLKARDGDVLSIDVVSRRPSVAAIKKKLLGQSISAAEMHSIIRDIVDRQLSPVETTYFVASGYVKPYSIAEMVAMVQAMAETGETFTWPGAAVVDKHSVGGLAGNRTTMVAIPIVAAAGLVIPKTSSRAITSPAGTADTMEVLAPVSFRAEQVRAIVRQTGGCLIWGGGLDIAPADDMIIRLSRPLSLEPYDKMIVSIMAKKVAMGITHLVIDMPYGPETKIPSLRTARELADKFRRVARAFHITVAIKLDHARQPIGQGIGPALEARDVVRVLQQTVDRPIDLERKSVGLAGDLLELAQACRAGHGAALARSILRSGRAWGKMQDIIRAQGGQPDIQPDDLVRSATSFVVRTRRSGRVVAVNNRAIDEIARTLGAPDHKTAGLFLPYKLGQTVRPGQPLFSLYSYSDERLWLARKALERHRVLQVR